MLLAFNMIFTILNTHEMQVNVLSVGIPVVTISGGSLINTWRSVFTVITAVVSIPQCSPTNTTLLFSWHISPSLSTPVVLDKSSLVLPPGVLNVNSSYVVSVKVSYQEDTTINATTSTTISVGVDQLVVNILGGKLLHLLLIIET